MSTTRGRAPRHLVLVAGLLGVVLSLVMVVAPGARTDTPALAAPGAASSDPAVASAEPVMTRKARKALARKRLARQRAAAARQRARAVLAADARWAGGVIRYRDALPATYAWSLRTAVAQWNASGADLTLVPVSDPAQAQLTVRLGDTGAAAAVATVGRTRGAFVELSRRYATVDEQDPYYQVEVLGVLAHELGHVVGLDHVAGTCGLMSTMMDIVGCGIYDMASPQDYRCDVLGLDAPRLAAASYGGTPAPARPGRCTVGG